VRRKSEAKRIKILFIIWFTAFCLWFYYFLFLIFCISISYSFACFYSFLSFRNPSVRRLSSSSIIYISFHWRFCFSVLFIYLVVLGFTIHHLLSWGFHFIHLFHISFITLYPFGKGLRRLNNESGSFYYYPSGLISILFPYSIFLYYSYFNSFHILFYLIILFFSWFLVFFFGRSRNRFSRNNRVTPSVSFSNNGFSFY